MKKSKILLGLLVGAFTIGLVSCGSGISKKASDDKTIKIGVSPVPHKEIVENAVKPLLEEKGYKVEVVEFTDYVQPNTALSEKEIDANFFQHIPYLEEANEKQNLGLTYTAKVHLEPIGFYSEKIKDIKELKDGDTVAIPSDATNGARALKLLQDNGLIKLKEGELVTAKDITENPKNLKIQELEAAQLPRILKDVDGAVINTNFALEANLNPLKDALVLEDRNSPYANIIAVREEEKNSDKIKDLTDACNSEKVKKYIEDTYNGTIIPAF